MEDKPFPLTVIGVIEARLAGAGVAETPAARMLAAAMAEVFMMLESWGSGYYVE